MQQVSPPTTVNRLIGVAALPRSGTTLVCSIFSVHSRILSIYEPWNATKNNKNISDAPTIAELVNGSGAALNGKDVLLIKETGTQLRFLRNLRSLLESQTYPQRDLVIILRNPLHVFLSEVQARREWWGEQALKVEQEVFDKWAKRSLEAISLLDVMAIQADAFLLSYEALAEDGNVMLQLMNAMGISPEPAQLEYEKHINVGAVRGDIGLASGPRPVNPESCVKREQELEATRPVISASSWFEQILHYAERADSLRGQGFTRRGLFGPLTGS